MRNCIFYMYTLIGNVRDALGQKLPRGCKQDSLEIGDARCHLSPSRGLVAHPMPVNRRVGRRGGLAPSSAGSLLSGSVWEGDALCLSFPTAKCLCQHGSGASSAIFSQFHGCL